MGTFVKSNFVSTDTTAPRINTVYALDSFNRADAGTLGSTEIGGYAWTTSAAGIGSISGNKAVITQPTTAGTARIDDGRSNGVLTVTLATVSALTGVVFRGAAGGNAEYALYATQTNYEMKPKTGADAYGTAYTRAATIQPAIGDVVQVTLNGPSIIVKVNGVTAYNVTDSAYTGTTKGLFARANTAQFDNFRWEPLP